MNEIISRRSVLGGLSSAAGLAACGAGPRNEDWDLIVVGAGTAGLPAAIFSAARGARVLIIDTATRVGGSLLLATGQMSAAGTKVQQALGIEDTPELHYQDIMRISNDTADPTLVRLAVENAAATFDWLMERGFEMVPSHPVAGLSHEPYSERRYYWGVDLGRSILAILEQELQPGLEQGQITLALETRVTELTQTPDGTVTGIVTKDNHGAVSQQRGRQIMLACGGYASNPVLFEELCGQVDYGDTSYEYSQGDGIGLGTGAGGYVRGRRNYLSNFGNVLVDDNFPARVSARCITHPDRRQPWEIYVNANGQRFLKEDVPSVDVREHALLEQPDLRYWSIFDQAIFDQAPVGIVDWTRDDLNAAFDGHPMFYKHDTVEGLAEACGLPAAALEETIRAYNEGVATGSDPFGRQHLPRAIDTGPFYAIRVQGYSTTSTVGMAVDEQLRVIREDGSAINNLYAAGELLGAGQTMGQSFCGGMMITPALTFGRLLGQRILNFA
jgi:fumarate reductase flavoprotein subunit